MNKLVFTIREDFCDVNGKKDENIQALLEKMKEYGTIVDFDEAVKAVKDEYQENLNNLTARLRSILSNELAEDEVLFLTRYRECKTLVRKDDLAENAKLIAALEKSDKQLQAMREAVLVALGKEQ